MFATVEEAIEDFKAGKIVIVTDDENRENKRVFIVAAEKVSPEIIGFMMQYGKGALHLSITKEMASNLDLDWQFFNKTSLCTLPLLSAVDCCRNGHAPDISICNNTANTILDLVNSPCIPANSSLFRHIDLLNPDGKEMLDGTGYAEAGMDLAHLCNMRAATALMEIIDEDGTSAGFSLLDEIAKKFYLKIVSIGELRAYQSCSEELIERGEEVHMPTFYGDFHLIPFREKENGKEHIAIFKGDIGTDVPLLTRIHSSCATGDIFSSMRCDCGEQLHVALETIEKEGRGIVIYLNQEGRGIGLMDKMKAYKLQEQGFDTVEANLLLGHEADERDYSIGANILRILGVSKVRLMTNNPLKCTGLSSCGLDVTEIIPIQCSPNEYNKFYLQTKKNRMGHKIDNLDVSQSKIEIRRSV